MVAKSRKSNSKNTKEKLEEFLSGPKILVFDIETSFKIVGVWGLYKQDISPIQIIQDTHVLCWAAKWLGSTQVYSDALHHHKENYKKDPTDDSEIVKSAWHLLDEADYVMAHNAKFDVTTMNSRFLQNGLGPPSSFQMIDTLQIARKHFRFSSNKLGSLGTALGVGEKLDTGGFQLWKDIILQQDKEAFDRMLSYCENDVILLEKTYMAIRAWHSGHPNVSLFGDLSKIRCGVCQSEKVVKKGLHAASTNVYDKYKCSDCGHNMRARKSTAIEKEHRGNVLRSV